MNREARLLHRISDLEDQVRAQDSRIGALEGRCRMQARRISELEGAAAEGVDADRDAAWRRLFEEGAGEEDPS